jgi:hypothetical protein
MFEQFCSRFAMKINILICANLIFAWSGVIPEKLIISQLLKKFSPYYATRGFIALFVRAQNIYSHHPLHTVIVSSRHFSKYFRQSRTSSPKFSLPVKFSTKFQMHSSTFQCVLDARLSHPS